jgi:hypothetical protein
VSKPRKPASKFSPHKWGVTVAVAFARIEASVGALEFAEADINEGLRSERLKSGEWQISPDSEGTWRRLNSSDWAKRRVGAHRSMFVPRPGVFALAPREGTYIEGPQFTGQVFICRADLDKHYRIAATPTMTAALQSDDTQPPERRRGPMTTHDWHSIDGEIARRCIDPKTGRLAVPKKESALVAEMRTWCKEQDWAIPAISEMSEAVRRVCARLRTVQK